MKNIVKMSLYYSSFSHLPLCSKIADIKGIKSRNLEIQRVVQVICREQAITNWRERSSYGKIKKRAHKQEGSKTSANLSIKAGSVPSGRDRLFYCRFSK